MLWVSMVPHLLCSFFFVTLKHVALHTGFFFLYLSLTGTAAHGLPFLCQSLTGTAAHGLPFLCQSLTGTATHGLPFLCQSLTVALHTGYLFFVRV